MNAIRGFAPSNIKNMGIFCVAWSGAGENRQLATADFSVGFSPHREIIRFCKDFDERVHYIQSCTKKGGRR